MNLAFRVDASAQIGLGHLMRCIALAHACRRAGAAVRFVTRTLGAVAENKLRAEGFETAVLPPPAADPGEQMKEAEATAPPHAAWAEVPWYLDAEQTLDALPASSIDWLVVDCYAFDAKWHAHVARATGARICVIDDLADRPLQADLVVDHNLAENTRSKYAPVLQKEATVLAGPRFALLAAIYQDAAPYVFHSDVRSIGVFVGGSDPWGASQGVLRACRDIAGFRGPIEVVSTSANRGLPQLIEACNASSNTTLSLDRPDLASFFASHDLHVGAGGGALLERCRIGAPTVAVACASNQVAGVRALGAAGAIKGLEQFDEAQIGVAVQALIADAPMRQSLHQCARRLVDGRGATRVACAMLIDTMQLVPAQANEAELTYAWRNDARTRRYFRDPEPLEWPTHLQWWMSSLGLAQRRLLIAACGELKVGVVRLDIEEDRAEVSIYIDPQLQGLGIGVASLRALQRWVRSSAPQLERLNADIHPENQRSAAAFSAAAFEQIDQRTWSWTVT